MDIPRADVREGAATGRDKSHAEGVFDRTQSVRSGAWGNPNKLHRNIENDIPMPCLLSISNCHFAPGVVYWFKTRILRR